MRSKNTRRLKSTSLETYRKINISSWQQEWIYAKGIGGILGGEGLIVHNKGIRKGKDVVFFFPNKGQISAHI